jgi:transposase-like protein
MVRKSQPQQNVIPSEDDLTGFACPNEECCDFNRFAAGNLRVCERMGKERRIRRLYCSSCGHRFSERQGSLLARSKLSEETVVRIVKCLGHGCSVEATADICEVDPRTVLLLLSKAGPRAEDFHRLQLDPKQAKADVAFRQFSRETRRAVRAIQPPAACICSSCRCFIG